MLLHCSYRMDYMKFVNYHRETNADITIGALPNSAERAKEFGLMKIDDDRRVIVSCLFGLIGLTKIDNNSCVIESGCVEDVLGMCHYEWRMVCLANAQSGSVAMCQPMRYLALLCVPVNALPGFAAVLRYFTS
eukprot:1138687-Pelagomonas_calceolata.AAC.3